MPDSIIQNKTKYIDAAKSFALVAVPTTAGGAVLAAGYAIASGLGEAIGLNSAASTGAGILSFFVTAGAATGVSVLTLLGTGCLADPQKFNGKAGLAGFFTGAVAAASLGFYLVSGEPADKNTVVPAPSVTAPASKNYLFIPA